MNSSAQIGMGFLSPQVASHTFPEYMGDWWSERPKEGEIRTVDGRTLVVSLKLSDAHGRDSVTAVINGEEYEIERSPFHGWIFKGDTVAEVVSAVAIGQRPALFIEHEKRREAIKRESDRRCRIETKKILREAKKQMEQRNLAVEVTE